MGLFREPITVTNSVRVPVEINHKSPSVEVQSSTAVPAFVPTILFLRQTGLRQDSEE